MGLLYVPDLDSTDPCLNLSRQFVPQAVTRRSDLPNGMNLIALAPWISPSCTRSFLDAGVQVSTNAMIFFTPDNSTEKPPPISSETWKLNDGGQWKGNSSFPVYAIPGATGFGLMNQLSLYSGNMSSAPFGQELIADGYNPTEYLRILTAIRTATSSGNVPTIWMLFLIIVASLGAALALTSFFMHYVQRRRREGLRRRIMSGDVNLEALGIKRLTVPVDSIHKMPLFIYMCPPTSPPVEAESTAESDGSQRLTIQVPIIHDPSSGLRVQPQLYQPQSQPTCPICLDDYESLKTVIRELPCGHIYHPGCIDTFLGSNSSLCPMCKKSALPIGYCPPEITNGMVRREQIIRLLRENAEVPAANDWRGRIRHWYNRRLIGRSQHISSFELQTQRQNVATVSGAGVPPGLSREEVAELRSRELLNDSGIAEEAPEERQRPKCRHFPFSILTLEGRRLADSSVLK